jgi:cytochrome c-type biogenesis protein CcmH/NrfG
MLVRVEAAIARRTEGLIEQANQQLAAGRVDDAQRALDQARALDAKAAGLASAAAALGHTRAAVTETRVPEGKRAPRVLTPHERRDVEQLFQHGIVAMREGHADEAVHYWELVWAKDPENVAVRRSLKQEYLARGMEAFAAGRLNDAVGYWEKALRMDPTDDRTRAYLARALEHLTRSREIGAR